MIVRQAAFGGSEKLLKGNTHTHTTRSDGACTPEETIHIYAEKGYDFLALTDHSVYNFTNFAPESGVLILPGTERDDAFPDSVWPSGWKAATALRRTSVFTIWGCRRRKTHSI